VAVAINVPNRQPQADPLEKLANALNVARQGVGIYTDLKGVEIARAKQAEEDKLRGLQINKLESEGKAAAEDDNPNSPLMSTIRQAAQRRGITLPEGITPRQARTNFDAFLKPKDPKVVDPVAEEIKAERLAGMKEKREKGAKRSQEFANRFRNIETQIANLDKLVESDGTAEVFGDHEKKLQQTIDSIAIDSAKLFDPESVARESEVAAFRNMLFTPGESTTADSTARGALENFKKIIRSRADNEGLSHLIDQPSAVTPQAGAVPKDVQAQAAAILAKRRAQARK
jgi:hypothetical protein